MTTKFNDINLSTDSLTTILQENAKKSAKIVKPLATLKKKNNNKIKYIYK